MDHPGTTQANDKVALNLWVTRRTRARLKAIADVKGLKQGPAVEMLVEEAADDLGIKLPEVAAPAHSS